MESKIEDLERIQNLKANGIITEKEFEIEKAKILANSENEESNYSIGYIVIALICSLLLGIFAGFILFFMT